MRAIVITEYGEPEVLQMQSVPDPMPQADELLIKVAATALNRADLSQRLGHYAPPPGAPPYPGLEVAGEVLEIGADVSRFRVGDRVMALLGGGGYAELVAVSEGSVMPVPHDVSLEEAAAIPEAWLTAYSNMVQIGALQKGERVLIHAGASGVGSAAIQLAKWLGATVFSTASSTKLSALKELGADHVIDYRTQAFADVVIDITNGEGVNLIVDFIGAPYLQENLRALALWGRLALVGTMGGTRAEINLGTLLGKKLSIYGSTLRDRTLAQKSALVAAFSTHVLPGFESGALYPVLDSRRFRLEDIVAAHRYMHSNQNVGKIIVTVP